MFDAVHLIKNIRNNLLHNKRFIFPAFHFDKFRDEVNVTAGPDGLYHTIPMFGMLEMLEPIMRKYNVNERRACEKIMKLYDPTPGFACGKIANRITH